MQETNSQEPAVVASALDKALETPASDVKTVSTEIPAAQAPAPEAPKKREVAEIQKEYQYLCFQAGEIQYQILMYEQALGRVNAKLQMINNEAAEAEAAQNKKKLADDANKAKQEAENKAKAEAKRARKAGDADPSPADPQAEATA